MRGSRSDWLGAVIARSPCDEAIHSFFTRRDGLLRFARNDNAAGWWSEAIPINATRVPMGIASLHPSYESRIRLRTLAARCARSFARKPCPRKQRARGRPGARCTRGLAGMMHNKMRPRAYRFSGEHTGLPHAMALRLIRVRPGDRLSCHHHLQQLAPSHDLTPAPGRQAHTTSPYAHAALVSRSLRVHRSLSLVCDDGQRPSGGTGWRESYV